MIGTSMSRQPIISCLASEAVAGTAMLAGRSFFLIRKAVLVVIPIKSSSVTRDKFLLDLHLWDAPEPLPK